MQALLYVVVILVAIALFLGAILIATRSRRKTGNGSPKDAEKWWRDWYSSTLVLIVTVAIAWWGYKHPELRPADAGRLSWMFWLMLSAIFLGLYAIVALNATRLGAAARTLKGIVGIAATLAFLGLPTIGWLQGCSNKPVSIATRSESVVPLANMPDEMWGKLVLPPRGRTKVPASAGHHIVMKGDWFHLYVVYPDGRKCSRFRGETCPNAPTLENWVENESSRVNEVIYAFAPNSN